MKSKYKHLPSKALKIENLSFAETVTGGAPTNNERIIAN